MCESPSDIKCIFGVVETDVEFVCATEEDLYDYGDQYVEWSEWELDYGDYYYDDYYVDDNSDWIYDD